jgi:transposase
MSESIHVGIDVGARSHHVGIATSQGEILEELVITHCRQGFDRFFERVEHHRRGRKVKVAMEGYGGHARPLDQEILRAGYQLLNVNNLKLARFREAFPAPAKTDGLDVRLILDLLALEEGLRLSKQVLQQVAPFPEESRRLKRLCRRRRELVEEKGRISSRLQQDLRSVCPELLSITGSACNLWFLRFLSCRKDLRQLARLKEASLLKIPGVGKKYAQKIRSWQNQASFSEEVSYVGPMIITDARRILELLEQIAQLEKQIGQTLPSSSLASLLLSVPGFGEVTAAELAGEIGTLERFSSEASLALYLGVCPLDRSSGRQAGSRVPRQVNRRARQALANALIHHVRLTPQSQALYGKKRREGKSHNQALRVVGRHLCRVIWCMLKEERPYEKRPV